MKEGELISSLWGLKCLRDIHAIPYRMIHGFVLFTESVWCSTTNGSKYYYDPHFTDEELKFKDANSLLKVNNRSILFQTQGSKMVPVIFSQIQDKSSQESLLFTHNTHSLFDLLFSRPVAYTHQTLK